MLGQQFPLVNMTLQRLYLALAENPMSQIQRSKGHEYQDLALLFTSSDLKIVAFTDLKF